MTLYIDPFGLTSPPGTFTITDEATYVEARRQILAYQCGALKPSPTFVVRNPPYVTWFDDLPERLRVYVSPRTELQKKYTNISLPADLKDQDIVELNLLNSDVLPTKSALLTHYFGSLLNRVDTTPATLLALIQFIIQQTPILDKHYLRQIWNEQLASLPDSLKPLREADKEFASVLAKGIYTAGIPAMLTDWEDSNTVHIKTRYSIELADLLPFVRWTKRTFDDIPALETAISKFLRECLTRKSHNPNTILPGIYRAELEALLGVTPSLTVEQRQELADKYAQLLTPELQHQLETRVAPVWKEVPNDSSLSLPEQARAWQTWGIDSFIPYKFWLDNLPNPTDQQLMLVESGATAYGDWLFTNYTALLAQNSLLANYDVRRQVHDILTKGYRVIWLIIDGFPTAYVALLEQQLRKHGLVRQVKQYALAPLPTITEIGIPALLNGLTPDSSQYTTDRDKALQQAFSDYSVNFASVKAKFQGALDSNSDLCCLHWQEIDQTLHRDDNDFDSPTARLDHIASLLSERLGKLVNVMNQWTDRPTKLVISTDHGATKCLRNGLNIKNDKITEAASANPRERSVKLEGRLLSVHIDRSETYHLTSEITHNPIAYVAARGYRYFGKNDRGYRHGGLTPEETIVPVLIAEMAAFSVEPLQLTYYGGTAGLPKGKTIKDFRIQARNVNKFNVEVFAMSIQEDANGQFELPKSIQPGDSIVITGTLKIAQKYKAQNGHLSLHVSIAYQASGEEFTETAQLIVPIQSSELDDFFDF